MSIPYESSSVLDTPMPSQDSHIEYPFVTLGDTTTKIYHIHCVVKDEDYVPLALDTAMTDATAADVTSLPFAADAAAYHIGDYDHSVKHGVFRLFVRRFCNIPQTTTDSAGTELFTFPGLPIVPGVGQANIMTAASGTYRECSLTTTNPHGLSAGDNFRIYALFTYTYYGLIFRSTYAGNKVALAGTTGSTINFRGNLLRATFVEGAIYPNSARGRRQLNTASATQIVREYFLPGVTTGITTAQDIPIEPPFKAFSFSTGAEVNNLSLDSTPTSLEYNSLVNNDSSLIMQENIKQWFGNITVKESKQIRAM